MREHRLRFSSVLFNALLCPRMGVNACAVAYDDPRGMPPRSMHLMDPIVFF